MLGVFPLVMPNLRAVRVPFLTRISGCLVPGYWLMKFNDACWYPDQDLGAAEHAILTQSVLNPCSLSETMAMNDGGSWASLWRRSNASKQEHLLIARIESQMQRVFGKAPGAKLHDRGNTSMGLVMYLIIL